MILPDMVLVWNTIFEFNVGITIAKPTMKE